MRFHSKFVPVFHRSSCSSHSTKIDTISTWYFSPNLFQCLIDQLFTSFYKNRHQLYIIFNSIFLSVFDRSGWSSPSIKVSHKKQENCLKKQIVRFWVTYLVREHHHLDQCDQIGRFIGLWATFQSLWQQLICPNLLHS